MAKCADRAVKPSGGDTKFASATDALLLSDESVVGIVAPVTCLKLLPSEGPLHRCEPHRYSKFGTGIGVNSRGGLALAYATPIVVYIALWIEGGVPQTPYHLVVLAAFPFHFVRRTSKILFVNSYSRPTPLRALVTIALLYGGAATLCAHTICIASLCRLSQSADRANLLTTTSNSRDKA